MKIKYPAILEANDYHEFNNQVDLLNKLALPDAESIPKEKLKFIECGFYNASYHAILYAGKKPSLAEVLKEIIKEEKLNTMDKIADFVQENDLDFKTKDLNQALDLLSQEQSLSPVKAKKNTLLKP